MNTSLSPDARAHRLEQRICALAIWLMGGVVFLDVVHRTASREHGLLERMFGEAEWVGWLGLVIGIAVSWVLFYGALRVRGAGPGVRTTLQSAGLTAAGYAALRIFLVALPNGLVWSQTLGLVLMLGIACVGASMAAYEHRHLSLDFGSRVWPRRMLPYVQAVGNLVTAVFCAALTILSIVSIRSHYGDFVDTDGSGGTFVALPIPKWVAFLVMPLGFSVMTLRFLGQVRASLRGQVEEDDPLQMLGLKADPTDGEGSDA